MANKNIANITGVHTEHGTVEDHSDVNFSAIAGLLDFGEKIVIHDVYDREALNELMRQYPGEWNDIVEVDVDEDDDDEDDNVGSDDGSQPTKVDLPSTEEFRAVETGDEIVFDATWSYRKYGNSGDVFNVVADGDEVRIEFMDLSNKAYALVVSDDGDGISHRFEQAFFGDEMTWEEKDGQLTRFSQPCKSDRPRVDVAAIDSDASDTSVSSWVRLARRSREYHGDSGHKIVTDGGVPEAQPESDAEERSDERVTELRRGDVFAQVDNTVTGNWSEVVIARDPGDMSGRMLLYRFEDGGDRPVPLTKERAEALRQAAEHGRVQLVATDEEPDYLPPWRDLGERFRELIAAGCSPAEAVDYVMTEDGRYSQSEWADERGKSRQAVHSNVEAAKEVLGGADA